VVDILVVVVVLVALVVGDTEKAMDDSTSRKLATTATYCIVPAIARDDG
jgi:hypothetical protein